MRLSQDNPAVRPASLAAPAPRDAATSCTRWSYGPPGEPGAHEQHRAGYLGKLSAQGVSPSSNSGPLTSSASRDTWPSPARLPLAASPTTPAPTLEYDHRQPRCATGTPAGPGPHVEAQQTPRASAEQAARGTGRGVPRLVSPAAQGASRSAWGRPHGIATPRRQRMKNRTRGLPAARRAARWRRSHHCLARARARARARPSTAQSA